MDLGKYLERIGATDSAVGRTADSLSGLQTLHLLSIPFENLDIHWNRKIRLDEAAFFGKIVESGRGGFCYELNGLFAHLLREIGFEVRLVSARVAIKEGGYGPPFDHLALIVQTEDGERLVDVGFGDFSAAPLKFRENIEQLDANGVFRLTREQGDTMIVWQKNGELWERCYMIDPKPRRLSEFGGMCEYHQTSPNSHFTRGRLCSQMLEDGRKTLTEGRFVTSRNGHRTETAFDAATGFDDFLRREFGIAKPAAEGRNS